jgi:predicted nuclease with RNAse H fold
LTGVVERRAIPRAAKMTASAAVVAVDAPEMLSVSRLRWRRAGDVIVVLL